MALWMEAGSEPKTASEIADLEAITALKVSAALELKEKGNQYVKTGKKHYSDAIDCYTRALNQNVLSDSENSIIFANRAHVNLLLGNYRRALADAEDAIKLSPTNIKALYRAVKASASLNLLAEAKSYCENGLDNDPDNEELKKLLRHIDERQLEHEQHAARVSKAISDAKDVISAVENRGMKIGKAMFQEFVGIRKPILDKNNIIHWPVLLLYPEVMSSDFIEDFCETDMFSAHLDIMFSEGSPPLPWDKENAYTREAIELYYETGCGVCLSKTEILRSLLAGTAGSNAENIGDEEKDASSNYDLPAGRGTSKWTKMAEKKTLHDILREPNFIIPGIPVFYIVSKTSRFYHTFRSGKWSLPL